jgi:hypothetical protein
MQGMAGGFAFGQAIAGGFPGMGAGFPGMGMQGAGFPGMAGGFPGMGAGFPGMAGMAGMAGMGGQMEAYRYYMEAQMRYQENMQQRMSVVGGLYTELQSIQIRINQALIGIGSGPGVSYGTTSFGNSFSTFPSTAPRSRP